MYANALSFSNYNELRESVLILKEFWIKLKGNNEGLKDFLDYLEPKLGYKLKNVLATASRKVYLLMLYG
ncbi:hypothetical protein [Candidatus Borreliella tachyglossi]|uniref:hypothetical protein n=1 Tax=Candidatus Borreliella tachyglossi TaxID=1964448 RepID=UPI0026860AD0|nr:hypothetical protein [Candidatus Borreliella tachyglossi]